MAIFCTTSFAQAEGCNGSRYLAGGVFDQVAVSTVTYGENQNSAGTNLILEMDIYEPVGDTVDKRPVIILAHGGSFIFGAREDLEDAATEYARMGYVAVSITYRLFPFGQLGIPNATELIDQVVQAVGDMRGAVRFMRADAAGNNVYKIDPNNIFVGGISAGAITAMHLAQLDEEDEVSDIVQAAIDANGGLEGTTGIMGFSSEVSAVVNLSGGLHDRNYIDEDDVPFISFHGDSDGTVPFLSGLAVNIVNIDGSGTCNPRADEVGIDNFLVTAVDGDHVDIYTEPQWEDDRINFTINGNLFLHDILCPFTVNVENELFEKEITAYPNPSADQITIDLGTIESMYDVVVYDRVGKVVFKSFGQNDPQFILQKEQIGAGFFVAEIRVMEDGIQSITRKIIFE